MIIQYNHKDSNAVIMVDGKNKGEVKKHLKELLKGYPELPKTGWQTDED